MSIIKKGKNIIGVYKGSTPISKIYKGALSVFELNVVCDITATFDVTSTTEPTTIAYNSALSGFTRMCVDGVEVPVTDTHTFDTLGEHTVQYKLANETTIGNHAFQNCTSLTSIIISDSVTSMGYFAFGNCTSLTSVTIPNNVISIGDYAFSDCTSLTSVTIPLSVTKISSYVFYNCSNLTSITIPNNVISIGDSALYNCRNLTSVTIPNNVISIGDSAFGNCTSLTSITCHATTAPTVKYNTFNNIGTRGTLYVPNGSDYTTWISKLSSWRIQYIT